MKKHEKRKEPYLKVPAHILNLPKIGLCEKVLLAHIYSFGEKGCWQSNKTMADIFMVSPRTIERWLAAIREFIFVKNSKGYYRTIWAKSHPDFNRDRTVRDLRQDCRSDPDKNGVRVRQNCPTTINNTITENNKRTTASPSPLPACGQAPATLRYRKADAAEQSAKFKARFGRTTDWKPLTPEEFQRRRVQQLAALRTTEQIRRAGDNA